MQRGRRRSGPPRAVVTGLSPDRESGRTSPRGERNRHRRGRERARYRRRVRRSAFPLLRLSIGESVRSSLRSRSPVSNRRNGDRPAGERNDGENDGPDALSMERGRRVEGAICPRRSGRSRKAEGAGRRAPEATAGRESSLARLKIRRRSVCDVGLAGPAQADDDRQPGSFENPRRLDAVDTFRIHRSLLDGGDAPRRTG